MAVRQGVPGSNPARSRGYSGETREERGCAVLQGIGRHLWVLFPFRQRCRRFVTTTDMFRAAEDPYRLSKSLNHGTSRGSGVRTPGPAAAIQPKATASPASRQTRGDAELRLRLCHGSAMIRRGGSVSGLVVWRHPTGDIVQAGRRHFKRCDEGSMGLAARLAATRVPSEFLIGRGPTRPRPAARCRQGRLWK